MQLKQDYLTTQRRRLLEELAKTAKIEIPEISNGDRADCATRMTTLMDTMTENGRRSEQARQIRQALRRITKETYGTCIECGEDVPSKRLEAAPWAALCLSCQEEASRDAVCYTSGISREKLETVGVRERRYEPTGTYGLALRSV